MTKTEKKIKTEELFMNELKKASSPGMPIHSPKGFKKAYPKTFKAIFDAAMAFRDVDLNFKE